MEVIVLFDRDAARDVIRKIAQYGEESEGEESVLDALAGCVRPVPPQTIDRERLIFELWHAYDEIPIGLVDRIVALVAPDSRFDTIRALHESSKVLDAWCNECASEWPCATIRALDGDATQLPEGNA